MNIRKIIFGDWSKWKDVSCTEEYGFHRVIQTRVHNVTGKRQIRTVKFWVNDSRKMNQINENMFK